MKKIFFLLTIAALMASGCEKFLDTSNLTQKDTSNYPENQEDANDLLTGVYYSTRLMAMDENGCCAFVVSEILSDDRFAGGGPDDDDWHNLEQFKMTDVNLFHDTWTHAYEAIYRANTLLNVIDNVDWSGNESARDNILGQTYFLRGYVYFYLAQMFGSCPLVLVTEPVNLPRASAEAIYAQIAYDLTKAIELMPDTPKVSELGRASRWAAEALMARVWLFYTGYYDKESLPLGTDSQITGEITKAKVIEYIDDCVNRSGLGLYQEGGNMAFCNLWPYSNEYTAKDYAFARDNNLVWAGETGGNYETIFAFTSSAKVNWDNPQECNRINLYFTMREQPNGLDPVFPWAIGWGFGPVNPQIWDSFKPGDPRKAGSILNVEDELPDYQYAADHQYHETGYWQKKYTGVNARNNDGEIVAYSEMMYPGIVDSDYQINNTQDLVVLRFADVLLMQAELKEDAEPLNKVRRRSGLADVTYTLENLQNERRWELAFEGLRYYDLLRWGIAGEALAKQNGVAVKNDNMDETMDLGNIASRIAETGGFMFIPPIEIELSNYVLEQTQGW